MNLSKSAVRRYRIIDGLLRNTMRSYPTMEDIIDQCIEKLDFEPSRETIQKDLANMRLPYPDGFDAPIRYCYTNKGYEYTEPNYSLSGIALKQEDIDTIREAVDLIRCIGSSRISSQFNHAVEKLLSATVESRASDDDRKPVLQTMIPPASRGLENFDILYSACKERIPLSIIHFSYTKRTFKHTYLHGFLIKEFDNRWYIIGFSETHNCIRTFGIDRISDPLKIKKPFKVSSKELIDTYLNDVYGVYPIPGAQKELITISVIKIGTHYFQAYPIHESQVIKKNNSGSSTISFSLIASDELARYILAQGNNVRVQSPLWFKKYTHELTL